MKTAHDLVAEAKAHVEELDLEGAEAALREADVLIDVREADEYHAGHLPGAVNIPRGVLEFRIGADPALVPRDLDILLYCKTSGRAALAARSLQAMGYLRVRSIAGGFDAWQAGGKPVSKPATMDFD